ncbi:hypothetical protein G3I44_15510 [Halogeometricum borinquense]|uniref:Uncharacterized protein n=1 Tax=Halogeometricum borinquense TaxID=60847 RepID=A0A6C0UJG0_9EURY|nr:hypothetical protein [Halogeometricum borinquense]QIB75575.1 hypothetical protein G3I44_15510 [Halogeometricum borinquense]
MVSLPSKSRKPLVIGVLGGLIYSVIVLWWSFSRGVYFASGDLLTVAIGVSYAVVGLFLMAAVPLFLLARFSLILPAGVTLWLLGNNVYQELYGTHLHPLSSYLTVWPLLFGMALAAGLLEVLIRYTTQRGFGRGGFRLLV